MLDTMGVSGTKNDRLARRRLRKGGKMETGERRRRGAEAAGAALSLALLLSACAPPSELPPVVTAAPPARQIVVESGQTLSGIAHAYHVPMLVVADANHLSPPYRILAGQVLLVPGGASPVAAAPVVAMAQPNPAPTGYPGPAGAAAPVTYAPVGQPLAPPIAATPLPPPRSITSDRAPPATAATPLPLTPTGSAAPSSDRPRPPAASIAPATVATVSPPVENGTTGATASPRGEAVAAAEAPPSQHGGDNFLWPVKGRVVEGYGTGPDGTRNDGINIAAPKGAAIEATGDGIVAYAGNELRGYGNLILIKHPNGWISAYAHCDVILVHTGQKVARGQVIARVGTTGNVDAPQLHFELRRGKKPVDPRQYLATSPAEAGKQTRSG
jgi:murein DD-endopeptidase MepM/ murein hydrolase activator NlpD